MNKIPIEVSQHLRFIGLVSSFFIVYIHGTTLKYSDSIGYDTGVGQLQSLLSHNVFHVALAVFFISSSFFLFAGVNGFSSIFQQIRKRGVTLLMPYLFWSSAWLILVYLVKNIFNINLSIIDSSLFWHLFFDPLPGQLWFLRDLIFLVLISPVFLLVNTYALIFFTFMVMAWWLHFGTPTVISLREGYYQLVSNQALAWFLVGCVLAREPDFFLKRIKNGVPSYLLVVFALIWIFIPYLSLPGNVAHGISVISGSLFLFLSISLFKRLSGSQVVRFLSSYTLLIYLAHHPALGVIQSFVISINPRSEVLHLATYLFIPGLVILAIVVFFGLVDRFFSSFIFVANGGRKLEKLFKTDCC
ncbi:acyltransferase family protein [Vibrio coralliirubri]|uniref:acyltransferase family protein n=1 Tax=Vibrio coralliirubri TaxID=1516159 RepID=UPI00067EDB1B|nr:acyltransferase family protein [Vibrio coralliirubri]